MKKSRSRLAYFRRTTKLKNIYYLTEGEPLSDGRKKNERRNERHPVGVESESLGRAEIRMQDGKTVAEHVLPRVEQAYLTGVMTPQLLLLPPAANGEADA